MSTAAAAPVAARGARRLAWSLLGLVVVTVAAYIVLVVADSSIQLHVYGYLGAVPLVCLAFATVGAAVASRLPRNPIGWLFLAIAFLLVIASVAQLYAIRGLLIAPHTLPLDLFAGWLASWVWLPGVGLTVAIVPLLFPSGRLPTPRWRGWLIAVCVILLAQALTAAVVVLPHSGTRLTTNGQFDSISSTGPSSTIFVVVYLLVVPLAVGSVAGLFVRFRQGDPLERQQLKFFVYAGVLVFIGLVVSAVGNTVGRGSGAVFDVSAGVLVTTVAAVPIAAGLAILRYRLYDIDVVISRTLVYGALAVLITGVYVGIAVGIGELVGSGGRPNLGLSILATAIVAVGFEPARERLQRVANRLVYGKRSTPYQVLSEFSSQVAGSYAADEVLPRMARVLQEATGSEQSTVWLRSGGALHEAATWPAAPSSARAPVEMTDGALPVLAGVTQATEVRHQGELLGALTVTKRRGESLTPVEEKLIADLAHQAGLVLKNVGLTADLQMRLEDLRASRQRLVSAQDSERRKLERNLHDGAQQHLVALKVKLGLAEILTERDPEKARATIQQLKADADEALETLRDLARGIYPPLLAEKGLVAALQSQAAKATLPVIVDADGVGRYTQEAEATVYFCVLEALQNVQKYANATRAVVRLREGGGSLVAEVEDDGAGFDPRTVRRGAGLNNMHDRLDAISGSLEISSEESRGTTVRAVVPIEVLAPVAT